MNEKNISFIVFFFICILFLTSFSVFNIKANNINLSKKINSNFYFIHITDTHIMNEPFGDIYNKYSKDRFLKVLDKINSFKVKPAFLVITGDLVDCGSGKSGALNYQTLVSCLFEEDRQFYLDSEHFIPVYFTPGNHDYYFNWNLDNYYKYIYQDRRYIIKHENLTLFFMDSGPHYIIKPKYIFDVFARGLEDEDIRWLEEQLNNSNSEHKIVLMHHPAINDRNCKGEMYDVFLKNREVFISLCEKKNVDLVLAGHTHYSRVFDSDEKRYLDYPINTSNYPTLFVQSKANKVDEKLNPDCNYRNISLINGDIFIEENVKVEFKSKSRNLEFFLSFLDILKSIFYRV
jgi:3',5'-cyclic AMP phosphodiesterase CpdA